MNYEEEFKEAMRQEGLVCLKPITVTNGTIPNRFKNNGKGNPDCWYFWNGTMGTFGDWHDSSKKTTWSAYKSYSKEWTAQQKADYEARKKEQEHNVKKHLEEKEKKYKKVSDKLTVEWHTGVYSDKTHPEYTYLKDKQVEVVGGIKYGSDEHGHFAAIPRWDINGRLWNLEKIYNKKADSSNNKWPIKDGRTLGLFHVIGVPLEQLAEGSVVYFTEGYATGASIHEVTKSTVIVVFSAGNLDPVIACIRVTYPTIRIIIAADNDQWKENGSNPGLEAAKRAASIHECSVVYPTFQTEHHAHKPTDFNDLNCLEGIEEVRNQLKQKAEECDKAWEAGRVHSSFKSVSSEPINVEPSIYSPYQIIRSHKSLRDGVYYFEKNQEGEDLIPLRICSPLEIKARTNDGQGQRWGYLLEWQDPDGKHHSWPMPSEMLAGQGDEYRRILHDGGLEIAPGVKAKNHLTTYIQTATTKSRAHCTDRIGWHEGVFVLPDGPIGEKEERILYQPSSVVRHAFKQRCTLDDWRQNVALPSRGNSRAMFAIACAFAPALLEAAGEESGGFNIYGESSSGKTTLLKIAASVWGSPDYLQRWRATTNGLEGLAQLHNDCLLILDELAQVDPKEAGEIAYMLGNGSGKVRSSREGLAKKSARWRLLYLSAGEISLADHVRVSGRGEVKAGQEIRLVDIPADAGKGLGVFEVLSGCDNPSDFSRMLCDTAAKYYGTASIAFLENIIDNLPKLPGWIREHRPGFLKAVMPQGASGQVERVALRFALVACAGELATKLGITGWGAGEVDDAVKACFKAWLEARDGTENLETQKLLADIRAQLEAHSESRFTTLGKADERPILNRMGFIREIEGDREYIILSEMFKRELCKGHNNRIAIKALLKLGVLIPDSDGKPQRRETLPKEKERRRCYVLKGSKLWGIDHDL